MRVKTTVKSDIEIALKMDVDENGNAVGLF